MLLGQVGSLTCHILNLLQITQDRCVRHINRSRFFEQPARTFIFLPLHIEKRQKLICLHKLGILVDHLFELNDRHILIVLATIHDRLIIFSDSLVDRIETVFVILKLIQIIICQVVLRLKIFADHPFAQRRNSLTCLIIAKTQKISGIRIFFVEFQAALQAGDSSLHVPYERFFQPLIIQKIGNPDNPLLDCDIGTAPCAVVNPGKRGITVNTPHELSLLSVLLFIPQHFL